MKNILCIFILFVTTSFNGDVLHVASEYALDEVYIKQELDAGTLDQDGNEIDFIFTPHQLNAGKYEISITDGPGDLYEIKGTDFYITFVGYYGYAGYGDEGLLIINTYGSGKFIRYED